jgi:hypothetical protein
MALGVVLFSRPGGRVLKYYSLLLFISSVCNFLAPQGVLMSHGCQSPRSDWPSIFLLSLLG